MNITRETLTALHACGSGIALFNERFPEGATLTEAVEWCIETGDTLNLQYASWLLTHLFDKPRAVRYAIFAAERVIGIFEANYPLDKRPRNAINAAKAWLENPGDETKKAAAYAAKAATKAAAHAAALAAYAAVTAATAAYAAADAAYAAADAAAAAYAADAAAAAHAAYAAVTDPAHAAARLEMKIRILRYGLTLIEGERS